MPQNGPARFLKNPLKKPDFVVAKAHASEEMIVRRASLMPPVFQVLQAGKPIGEIKLRSFFRNKYSIVVDGFNALTFRMPLFTIDFYGESSAGTEVWVATGPSEKEWNILIKPDVEEWPLVGMLAFIHTERWNYG